MKGQLIAQGNTTAVGTVTFCVASALEGESIDLTPPNDANVDGLADGNSSNVVVVSYSSAGYRVDDLAWTVVAMGQDNDDKVLDRGEMFEITVQLNPTALGEVVDTYHTFNIEVKPPVGSILVIERTTPAALSPVMILN